MLGALAAIFPNCGVGACIVFPARFRTAAKKRPFARSGSSRAQRRQQSVGKSPRAAKIIAPSMDPTRLFPGHAYERAIEAEPNGTTLHIAGDDRRSNKKNPRAPSLARAAQEWVRGSSAREHKKAMNDASDLRALNSHLVQTEKLASLGQSQPASFTN